MIVKLLTSLKMKLALFVTFFPYLVISIPIIVWVYEQSHFHVVKLGEELLKQDFKQYSNETWNIVHTFRELNGDGKGTPSEIRRRILDSISMIAFIISNLCDVWKDPTNREQYQSCDFSTAYRLHRILDKMRKPNKTESETYLFEVQDIFDNHFDYWNVFVVANKVNQKEFGSTFRIFKGKQFQDQKDIFKRLQIDTSDSKLRKEMKNTFNLFLDLSEEYYNCLQHFPDLKDYLMEVSFMKEVGTTSEGNKIMKLESNQPEWKFAESLKRNLNLLYLYLCLNHRQMIYINSTVALLSAFWWFHIGIVLLYCVFPTVPFGIALSLEAFQHYAYRKIFGCACRIKKKLSILKVLAQARRHHMPKIPKFDNMRMYKRRKRKVDSNK